MRELSKEEAKALGFDFFWKEECAVEIDEVKGATIAALYMDSDPTEEMNNFRPALLFRIVLVLTDGRCIVLTEGAQDGHIEAEFGQVEA